MFQNIKKYLSLFCLIAFLFPVVETNVHAFEHRLDIHCDATDKHFHESEHSCSLCEFTITDSNSPAENTTQPVIFFQSFLFNPFTEGTNTPPTFQDLPARAPPVV